LKSVAATSWACNVFSGKHEGSIEPSRLSAILKSSSACSSESGNGRETSSVGSTVSNNIRRSSSETGANLQQILTIADSKVLAAREELRGNPVIVPIDKGIVARFRSRIVVGGEGANFLATCGGIGNGSRRTVGSASTRCILSQPIISVVVEALTETFGGEAPDAEEVLQSGLAIGTEVGSVEGGED
jgi:hypothetical protein